MDADAQRAALAAAITTSGKSCAQLSRLIGRNAAYVQQYLKRGLPGELAERDRAKIARFLGMKPEAFGVTVARGVAEVSRLDVGASAGPGGLVDAERALASTLFDPSMLRRLGVRPEAASMVRVAGDSMERTLRDGDEILVDRDRRSPGVRGELFVLRLDGAVAVKRLRWIGREIEVASDNEAYATVTVEAGAVDVIGRVVWLGRALL
ncbi:S24 family peptidase [Sphingomonas sp. G-3-2-10]|uniref:S24 family peptidase n=1 Tax=Sphingomonas sp. G-3-2-10 TaxID=2728838 RepID=UPI00146D68A3|nr:S24 family peptidase [Sphingomonas sp. G-3-2-10]NML06005.1 S24 family peptidase [Sphingomonas sp. G-3-2-10]